MESSGQLIEIAESDIRAQYPAALALLEGFDHAPRHGRSEAQGTERDGLPNRRRFRSTTPGLMTQGAKAPVRLLRRIEELSEDALTTPAQARGQTALRRALAVARAVAEQEAKISGLAEMRAQNAQNRLPEAAHLQFSNLMQAESLITLQVFALTLRHVLPDGDALDLGTPEEVLLDNGATALRGALWELDQTLARHATSDARLAPAVRAYAEGLLETLALRSDREGLSHFKGTAYRIEDDDLTIEGFAPPRGRKGPALTMQFKKPHEVVGNHIAKRQAQRLAKMLMAYDFDRRLNPFAELGGFIFTFMGDGKPGTGKTTLIQMMAGLIHGYCEVAGYTFRYANLSTESIDSYQGKSAQNAKSFINQIIDPSVIGFGTIDDIDQLAGKRGDRQSSAGQLEITAVLMESFAGANTVVRGNCTFGMFSNYPEAVDDALRQRAGARFLVDGPQSEADYIDILHLLMGKHHDIPLGDHDLYAAQALKKAVARSYEAHARPHDETLANVFDKVVAQYGPLSTITELGRYLKAIQQEDERFTGRAIKNITDAVKTRAMDFELPDDWMAQPDLFLRQDYDTKKAMIADLRQPVTPEMVLQEINRYADSEFRYAGKSDEAAIDEAVRDMRRMEEAKRRYLEGRE
ncbi:MAG: AAA family ATPase [Rhodobacterales bacterium]|nr:MAG: AAA family ATPase [Rhodobacterales bacterium]